MKIKQIYVILPVIVFNSFQVNSTTLFQLSLQEMAEEADKIVQAKVTEIVSQWNKDSSVIFSYVRMNIVDDLIGGDENNEIIIKLKGGRIGNKSHHAQGITNYTVGEEDVLFLSRDKKNKGTFQTLGMYQGKYKIIIDENSIKRVKQDNSDSVVLYKRRGRGGCIDTGNNKTLDEFKCSIHRYIKTR